MPHNELDSLIREEVQRHKKEQLNEIFSWLKKLWQSITDSDWDRVQRASNDPESGLPKISREKWNKSSRWEKDAWVRVANEWLDIPEDTKREMLYKALSRRASLNKYMDQPHRGFGKWDYRDRFSDNATSYSKRRHWSELDEYDDDELEWRRHMSPRRGSGLR